MKKTVLPLVLILILSFVLLGCSVEEETETTVSSLINEYQNFPTSGIIDTSLDELYMLADQMYDAKFRLSGIATDINTSFDYFDSGYLVVGENKIRTYFEKEDKVKDGEYVEVVGKFSVDADHNMCQLSDCSVVERGSSVRERIEE